jgi:glutathione S-transferase
MGITITAFDRSPDGGEGLARDTRVRWALEEAGENYDVRPVTFRELKTPRISRCSLSARYRPMKRES